MFAVIYARDEETERGNVGEVNGPALFEALLKVEKDGPSHDYSHYLMMQGVDYKRSTFDVHDMFAEPWDSLARGPYLIAHPNAVNMTLDLITNVTATCGDRTKIILAGYRRGLDVIRFAVRNITEPEKTTIFAREYQLHAKYACVSLTFFVTVVAYSDDKHLSKPWTVDKRYPALGKDKVIEFCNKHDTCEYIL